MCCFIFCFSRLLDLDYRSFLATADNSQANHHSRKCYSSVRAFDNLFVIKVFSDWLWAVSVRIPALVNLPPQPIRSPGRFDSQSALRYRRKLSKTESETRKQAKLWLVDSLDSYQSNRGDLNPSSKTTSAVPHPNDRSRALHKSFILKSERCVQLDRPP